MPEVHPNVLGHDPALAACIALLRNALTTLVEAVQLQKEAPAHLRACSLFACDAAIDNAQQVLRMETGRQAQAEMILTENLASEGYTLADFCHHHLYGVPRAPCGRVPTLAEVRGGLGRDRDAHPSELGIG